VLQPGRAVAREHGHPREKLYREVRAPRSDEGASESRREIIAQVWTRNASYVDPVLQGEGQAEIDAMVQSAQQRFPGHRFRRTGAVDMHHDRVRFGWELGPEGGDPVVVGTDFAVVAGGERLQAVTGFFDRVDQPAA